MSVEQFQRARELEDVLQKQVETQYLREVDGIANTLRNDLLDEMIAYADGQKDVRTASMHAVRALSEWKMFANAINECVKNGSISSLRKVKEALVDSASMLRKEKHSFKKDEKEEKEDEQDLRGKTLEKMFGKNMLNAVNTVANQLRNDMMASMVPKGSGFGPAWLRQSLDPWKKFGEALHVRHMSGNTDDENLIKSVMSGAVQRLMKDIQIERKKETVKR